MNDVVKNLVLWIVIAVVLLSVFHSFGDRSSSAQSLIYSDFLTQVEQGQIREVSIEGQNISGKIISGTPFTTYSPETSNSALIGDLQRANVAGTYVYQLVPVYRFDWFMDIFHASDARWWRWSRGNVLRQEQGAPARRRPDQY